MSCSRSSKRAGRPHRPNSVKPGLTQCHGSCRARASDTIDIVPIILLVPAFAALGIGAYLLARGGRDAQSARGVWLLRLLGIVMIAIFVLVLYGLWSYAFAPQ